MDPNFVALDPVRLLMIDYDVTRFHSFDFFRWALLNRELFYSVIPPMDQFAVSCQTIADQVNFYRLHVESFNPLDNFKQYRNADGNDHPFLVENLRTMMAHPRAKITPTDLEYRFDIVMDNKMVNGTLLQFTDDPHLPEFVHHCKIECEKWDDILDLNRLAEFTMDRGYNAVMCGAVDILAPYLVRLMAKGYQKRMTILYGKYAYNYDWHVLGEKRVRMMKQTSLFGRMEVSFRHSFASFDPFTGLTYNEAMIRRAARLEQEGENEQDGK